MAKNWAITVGINDYQYLQPLRYAKRDALLMQEFLRDEAQFAKIYFFSDDSPNVNGKSTRPNRSNLLRLFRQLFNKPFLDAGDNFWFFFSGHGMRHANRDYLMPCDGDPEDIENTAIPVNYITERLRGCGADNIVVILDACRSLGSLGSKGGEGIGRETKELARQQGVISIFSCSPQEYSYEIEALQQGIFTRALLDGLGIQGRCATVEKLDQYINHRVPELIREYNLRAKQTPYVIAEPVNKSHLILIPRHASLADIATLKNDAYRAQFNHDLDLAQQLWIRVLAVSSGTDMEAIEALQRIAISRQNLPANPVTKPVSPAKKAGLSLQTFSFETVAVDSKGEIIKRQQREAEYLTEDLGNGIKLEMVKIPGGSFMMGSPETEAQRINHESPQHQVTVPSFYMGKYPVTQAQYQAIMGNNPARFQGANKPVERVSWDNAVEFCQKLSEKTGKKYRLPSEAEWEYACRAETTTPFYFGETITTDLANYDGNYTYGSAPEGVYREETTEVGIFPPNAFGLYDMHGNVREWCEDDWHDNYDGAPTDGSAWLKENDNQSKLLRGGSWDDFPVHCRSAYRYYNTRDYRGNYFGFRVVLHLA